MFDPRVVLSFGVAGIGLSIGLTKDQCDQVFIRLCREPIKFYPFQLIEQVEEAAIELGFINSKADKAEGA